MPEVHVLFLYVGPQKSNAYLWGGKYLSECPDRVMTSVGEPES